MAVFLGIDVGTSGTKAVLIDENGVVLSTAIGAHEATSPQIGYSEQDAIDWWGSVIEAIRKAAAAAGIQPSEIDAVGPTGQMHGLVALDKSLTPIRPAILWNDQRSAPQCHEYEQRVGLEKIIEETGNRLLPGFTAPKLLWMREHEPDLYARIEHVLLPKDYIRYLLSGTLGMDVTDASGTSVFACGRRTWSDEILEALQLPRSWWPDTHESPHVVAKVNSEAAQATGLREGVPIVAGAGDQAASAVGMGLVEPGILGTTLGTSGVVFATAKEFLITPNGSLHAFCHAIPDTWHLMGVVLSGAGSLNWFHEMVVHDVENFQELDKLAASTPAGAEGLFFLPYLTGERTPHPDPDARACWIGLTNRHGRGHMARAVLEGVTHSLRQCCDLISSTGVENHKVRLSGGGAKSPIWRQLCADILGLPTATMRCTEGTAYGAALLAAVGGGAFDSVHSACAKSVHEDIVTQPGPDAKILQKTHEVYISLYPALAESFRAIANLNK